MSAANPDYVPQNIQNPLAWHYTPGKAADESDTVASFPGLLDVNDILGSPGTSLPPAGMVGEGLYASRHNASALPLTNNMIANLLTLALPPGDWDVWAVAGFELRNLPTSVSHWMACLTPLTGTNIYYPDQTTGTAAGGNTLPLNSIPYMAPLGPVITTTTMPLTYYLNAFCNWAPPAAQCFAFGNIYARRRR